MLSQSCVRSQLKPFPLSQLYSNHFIESISLVAKPMLVIRWLWFITCLLLSFSIVHFSSGWAKSLHLGNNSLASYHGPLLDAPQTQAGEMQTGTAFLQTKLGNDNQELLKCSFNEFTPKKKMAREVETWASIFIIVLFCSSKNLKTT